MKWLKSLKNDRKECCCCKTLIERFNTVDYALLSILNLLKDLKSVKDSKDSKDSNKTLTKKKRPKPMLKG
jgi:hypothetical protein